jgi:aminoglycoside/choline kinase family phosphotransferase
VSDSELAERVTEAARRAFGRGPSRIQEIAPGLGRRRFLRLSFAHGEPASVVARVEFPEDPARRPAGLPPEPPLEPLRGFLEQAGIPVPQRYGEDLGDGVLLLEDAGSWALRDAVREAPRALRESLYQEACDLIPRLQRLDAPAARIPAFGRRLDAAFFSYKADFFARFSLPLALGREPRPSEVEVVTDAFSFVAREMAAAPARLSHRDLQAGNVLVRPDRLPGARLVLIDLQGAFLAAPEYDLVCLLRDSYVELGDEEVALALDRIRPQLPDAPDPDTFTRRFDLLTLTRKGKDHALGFYQASQHGDPRELRFAPRCARYLGAAAARVAGLDPRLARLDQLIQRLPTKDAPDVLQP